MAPAIYGQIGDLHAKVIGNDIELTRQQYREKTTDFFGLAKVMQAKGIEKITLGPDNIQLYHSVETKRPALTLPTPLIDPSPVLSAMPTGIPEIDETPALIRLNSTTLEGLKDIISSSVSLDDYSRYVEPSSTSVSVDESYWLPYDDNTEITYYSSPRPSPTQKEEGDLLEGVKLRFSRGDQLLIYPQASETSSGHSGFSFTWQPRQAPLTDSQTSGTSQQEESTTTQSASEIASQNIQPTPGAVGYSEVGLTEDSIRFQIEKTGHTLCLVKENQKVLADDDADPECAHCHESIRRYLSTLKLFDCGHVYHLDCATRNHTCPLCPGEKLLIGYFSNYQELLLNIKIRCVNEHCLWFEPMKSLPVGHSTCPYPLSYLCKPIEGNFIDCNKEFLISWMIHTFEVRGFRVTAAGYYTNLSDFLGHDHEDTGPGIGIKAALKFCKLQSFFYPEGMFNNEVSTPQECFYMLSRDMQADFDFADLRAEIPGMFNGMSTTYIESYDITTDKLTVVHGGEREISIKLSDVYSPFKKAFDVNRFLELLAPDKVTYEDLRNNSIDWEKIYKQMEQGAAERAKPKMPNHEEMEEYIRRMTEKFKGLVSAPLDPIDIDPNKMDEGK